jgi:hypothetical protein
LPIASNHPFGRKFALIERSTKKEKDGLIFFVSQIPKHLFFVVFQTGFRHPLAARNKRVPFSCLLVPQAFQSLLSSLKTVWC